MAVPPEPLDEVLPLAEAVIEAEVVEVIAERPGPPAARRAPGTVGAGLPAGEQVVRLRVTRSHRGPWKSGELVALKPAAPYLLRPGHHGPLLLDGERPHPTILGRYGPDSWRLDEILAELSVS